MAQLTDLFSRARQTLADLEGLSWAGLQYLHRDEAILAIGVLIVLSLGVLLQRSLRTRRRGEQTLFCRRSCPFRRRGARTRRPFDMGRLRRSS